jgi:DNA-binding NarL/FixJ family response regulator
VDDNDAFREGARDLLERQGLTVVGVAATSDEALERASVLRPDVTLVDIDLGEENGFDLVRRLAGAAGLEHLHMVLISAYSESDFADLIASSPAIGFLSKAALSASAIRELLDHGPSGRRDT